MKKKNFAIYALMGAMVASPVFTSCVDSEESASVTALRNAKAEQLKSIATLNNAKAAAETTLAAADAAVKNAQAAQAQALADKYAAEAKIKELEAKLAEESYDAELAAALAQAQADLASAEKQIAYYQGEMEKQSLELQKQLASLEEQLLDAQKSLADKKDAMAEAEYQELKELAEVYSQRLVLYTRYSQAILNEEAELAAAKADLADWETLIAEDIASKENQIKLYQSQIETYKKYTNYTADIDAAKNELNELLNVRKLAQDKYNAANKAYNEVNVNELKEEYKLDELRTAIEATDMYKLVNWDLPYTYLVSSVNPVTMSWNGFEIEKEDYTYYDNENDSLNVVLEYKDVREVALRIEEHIAAQDVENKKKAIETEETGLQAVYDAAVKASAEAKKAYEAATTETSATKKAEYEAALAAEATAKADLETAQEELAAAEEDVAALELVYTLVSDEKAAEDFIAAVDAYNEVIVAVHTEKAEAYFAKQAAWDEYIKAVEEYNALNNVLNGNVYTANYSLYDLFYGNTDVYDNSGYTYLGVSNWSGVSDELLLNAYVRLSSGGLTGAVTIDGYIKNLENTIESLEKEIEDLKDTTDEEQAIEVMEADLEGMKAVQAAMKAELDATKAKLDALTATEE